MNELREVPPKTPILDAAEAQGGRVGLVAAIVRPFKALFERIRRRRVQKKIDARWHDVHVGKQEREDEP